MSRVWHIPLISVNPYVLCFSLRPIERESEPDVSDNQKPSKTPAKGFVNLLYKVVPRFFHNTDIFRNSYTFCVHSYD